MELDAKEFWARFDELRKKLDLKISTVENLCGFNARRISALKTREQLPTVSEVKTICNVLHVPYEYLFDGIVKSSKLNDMVTLYTKYEQASVSVQIVISQLLELDNIKICNEKKVK